MKRVCEFCGDLCVDPIIVHPFTRNFYACADCANRELHARSEECAGTTEEQFEERLKKRRSLAIQARELNAT